MKWLTILFLLFIILIIILADTGNLGMFTRLYRVPFADKAGHFILYGILALLVSGMGLGLAMAPGLIFAGPAVFMLEKGNKIGG